jgi:hypothetical protein
VKEIAQSASEILQWYLTRRWPFAVYLSAAMWALNTALYEFAGHNPWNIGAAIFSLGVGIIIAVAHLEGNRSLTKAKRRRQERQAQEWFDGLSPRGKEQARKLGQAFFLVASAGRSAAHRS